MDGPLARYVKLRVRMRWEYRVVLTFDNTAKTRVICQIDPTIYNTNFKVSLDFPMRCPIG